MIILHKYNIINLIISKTSYSHHRLEAVTLESNLGPITRLKLYLERVKQNKSLPSPEGRINVSII